MSDIIQIIVAVFFTIGAIDYFFNNKIGMAEPFTKGINSMGALALAMMGIYSLSPVLGKLMIRIFTPLSQFTGVDISIFSSIFICADLGGLLIAKNIAQDPEIGKFAGAVVSSTFGAALSFSLPVAIGIVKREDHPIFMKGFLIGLMSLPFGTVAGAFAQGLPLNKLIICNAPLVLVVAVIALVMFISEKWLLGFFFVLQKILLLVCITGFILLGLNSFVGIELLEGSIELSECFLIVGKVTFFLGGIYPLILLIQKLLSKQIYLLSKKIGVSSQSILCVLGNFVSNLVVFGLYKEMNKKGQLICAAVSISCAFLIGGQMGYIDSLMPDMIFPFVVAKLTAFIACIAMLYLLRNKLLV